MSAAENMGRNHDEPLSDLIPRPDPSRLTTAQLYREIASLKEIVFARIECLEEFLKRAEAELARHPDVTKEAVQHLKDMLGARMNGMDELRDQKFLAIQLQFHERDIRFDLAARESKDAVQAALSAAKEAVNKSEVGTIKQIDQLSAAIIQQGKTSDDKISDVKDRLNREEGRGTGRADVWGWIVAAVAALVAILEYKK